MAGRLRFGTVDQRAPKGRPKRWRARYDDPSFTGEGRPPRITAPETFPTKAAAEAWLARVWADVAAGTWEHPDTVRARAAAAEAERHAHQARDAVTVADWAEAWLDTQRRTMAPGTVRKRASNIRAHICPSLGAWRLIDLTPSVIQTWYDDLPSQGVRTACYQTLRAMLNAAIDSDTTALDTNPCKVRGGGKDRSPRGERYLLHPDEVEALAAAIRPDLRALVLLLADAGLRINEALALRREDVHLGDGGGFVDVVHSVARVGSTLDLGPTKTRRSRTVQIMPPTVEALRAHMRVFSGAQVVFPALGHPAALMRDTAASIQLRDAMARAGVVIPVGRYGGWHSFRHYSATRFGQAGASTAALMHRYGWTKPEQAMHYQRADADYERSILERMGRQPEPTSAAADAGREDVRWDTRG